ncbi:MAG: 2-oxoacid:acceptor oxidoreductase family protein [Candidatus Omnitrophica bacterium]|nr:2-oxoacid:acceptor oxidoreductase family protein [Candidatus Omnitrophota bacterium]
MTHRIIIAGEGGQGIMLLGKVLAEAAMAEGRSVTYLPAYGAEVRGGTANCMVIVSDTEIGSPLVQEADSLIIMNEPSLVRFAGRLSKKGTAFINSSLVSGNVPVKAGARFPFTDMAIQMGNQKCANMVALGCFCAGTKLIDLKTVMKIIEENTPAQKKELAVLNKKALEAGAGLCRQERDL